MMHPVKTVDSISFPWWSEHMYGKGIQKSPHNAKDKISQKKWEWEILNWNSGVHFLNSPEMHFGCENRFESGTCNQNYCFHSAHSKFIKVLFVEKTTGSERVILEQWEASKILEAEKGETIVILNLLLEEI